jgi:hypothetical protein
MATDIHERRCDIDDLALAARSRCAVLITAPADAALEIARTIAVRCGYGERMRVCDFGPAGARSSPLPEASQDAPLLLLREVQALTPLQQEWLLEILEKAQEDGRAPRIIASSSVSLFHQVQRGVFDARLFYRLNAVHLVVSDPDAGES